MIPTTSPFMLKSGPPELPGLMEASVWMKLSYGPAPMTRPLALTIPVVTVWLSPKGLPMARTQSPTLDLVGVAQLRRRKVLLGLDLQHRQIRFRIAADDLGLVLLFVPHRDSHFFGPVHHVVIGQNVAVRADDHP